MCLGSAGIGSISGSQMGPISTRQTGQVEEATLNHLRLELPIDSCRGFRLMREMG